MKIEHVAIWTKDIERLRAFYEKYFEAVTGDKYVNHRKRFESYFLVFSSGARLELMQMPSIPRSPASSGEQYVGYIHIAMSAGSEERVDSLTSRLEADGYEVLDGPRRTGDGYLPTRKCEEMIPKAERKRRAWATDLNRLITRSRNLVG